MHMVYFNLFQKIFLNSCILKPYATLFLAIVKICLINDVGQNKQYLI